MISLITCSVNSQTYEKFEKSVQDTIGVEHEIIRINNSQNQFSICKAYNLGGTKAKFEHLVFVHEDVTFITKDWGLNAIKHLKNKGTGLIGIAGAAYKPSVPSSWSLPLFTALHIVQMDKNSPQDREYRKINKLYDDPAEVITLDGVFLATKKSIFSRFKFDEKMLKGFHGYDIDYSFSVTREFKAFVVFDILLEHSSSGNQNKEWLDCAIKICNKWRKELPFSLRPLSKEEVRLINYKCALYFIWKTKKFGYSFINRMKLIFYFLPYKQLGYSNLFKLIMQIR